MRLLDTVTGRFRWIDNSHGTRYAILSHVWDKPNKEDGQTGHPGEQTYQNLSRIQEDYTTPGLVNTSVLSDSRVSDKIRNACVVARTHGYRYIWIDSCCINKDSSAELSEAINSMYQWYANASVCFAYLADVDDESLPRCTPFEARFRSSMWHTRGWTLQELIAPRSLIFLSSQWTLLGSKRTLAALVEEATGVDREILTHQKPLDTVSVAHRMWWASGRKTTRLEDEAYSLMGLFGVYMPTIYGEGRRAFLRLQEEVLRKIPDQSIFAWDITPHSLFSHGMPRETVELDDTPLEFFPTISDRRRDPQAVNGLLAQSPADFSLSKHIRSLPHHDFVSRTQPNGTVNPPSYTITPYGLRVQVGIRRGSSRYHRGLLSQCDWALLECEDVNGNLVALFMNSSGTWHNPGCHTDTDPATVGAHVYGRTMDLTHGVRLLSLPSNVLELASQSVEFRDVLFPIQAPVATLEEDTNGQPPSGALDIVPYPWCHPLLRSHGYNLWSLGRRPLFRNCLPQKVFCLERFSDHTSIRRIHIYVFPPYGVFTHVVDDPGTQPLDSTYLGDAIPVEDTDNWKSFVSGAMEACFTFNRPWPSASVTLYVSLEKAHRSDSVGGTGDHGTGAHRIASDGEDTRSSPHEICMSVELYDNPLVLPYVVKG